MSNSRLEGTQRYDYTIIEKIIMNKRSAYVVKCNICESIKTTYNLDKSSLTHNSNCENYPKQFIGKIYGEYMVQKAYVNKRLLFDLICLVCGAKRIGIAEKDLNIFKNKHGKHCTIKNTCIYDDKKLVNKLIRGYQNINTRVRKGNKGDIKYKPYANLEIDFKDSTEFVCELYDDFKKRINEGINYDDLTIERINTKLGYIKGNVTCATRKEQSENKIKTKIYKYDNHKYYNRVNLCKMLNISERKFIELYNQDGIYQINNRSLEIKSIYNVETIEKSSVMIE